MSTGGSLGNFKDTFQNLTTATTTGDNNDTESKSTTQKSLMEPSLNSRGYMGNTNLREALQTLGLSANNLMSIVENQSLGISAATSASSDPPQTLRLVEMELLTSLSIWRWKYQLVLYEACLATGIHVHFGKKLQNVTSIPFNNNNNNKDCKKILQFKDGSQLTTSLLIGADWINFKVHSYEQ